MEFQAIVLAGGKGTRMNDLTSSTIPKCLLKIGNRPMVYYSVRMLQSAGFKEINIITLKSIKDRVREELNECGITTSLNIYAIDDSKEENQDLGTAEALKFMKDKINHDCMIVSCDLISNVNIPKMTNFYRANDAAFLMLVSETNEQNAELTVPGSKGKYSPERDLIGYDPSSSRLLYFGAQSDIEGDKSINLKKSIIQKYPQIKWTTSLQDAHFYIIKKCLINYIINNPNILSLKGEFLPLVSRKQFSSMKHLRSPDHADNEDDDNNKTKVLSRPKMLDYLLEDDLASLINNKSSSKSNPNLLSCYLFMQSDGLNLRANNMSVFAQANRLFMTKLNQIATIQKGSLFHETSQVGQDSYVDDTTELGERVTVKSSVIGANCKIGKQVKISDSILMDNVTVEEGSTLTSCIVCSSSKIDAKADLKVCFVGYSEHVSGKHSYETIKEADSLMEL